MPRSSTAIWARYRISIRITFEAEGDRHDPNGKWQFWKDDYGPREARQRGRRVQAVEYPIEAAELAFYGMKKTCVETAFLDGFSLKWTTTERAATDYSAFRCDIPVRFNFLSTDFTHSGDVEGVPVRLFVKSELLGQAPPSVGTGLREAAELYHCRVKICKGHSAKKFVGEVAHVRQTIEQLRERMSCAEVLMKSSANANENGSVPRSLAASKDYKAKQQKRRWWKVCMEENDFDEEELHSEIQTLQDQLLSTKPVSFLNLPGDEYDDPDLHPLSVGSKLDDIEYAVGFSEPSFWTGVNQTYRPPSMRSRSSSMNSSLHGTPTFDPQEQDPVFLPSHQPRLQRSSGYNDGPNESSNSRSGLAPLHVAESSPDVYPSSFVAPFDPGQRQPHAATDAPPNLPPPPVELEGNPNSPFDCDICGEKVQVVSPREWQ